MLLRLYQKSYRHSNQSFGGRICIFSVNCKLKILRGLNDKRECRHVVGGELELVENQHFMIFSH